MAMKRALAAVVIAVGLLAGGTGYAHTGVKPKHGGVVREAHHLAFEMVSTADGVTIFVYDHDKPYATKGVSGKLLVLDGAQKSEAELKPAADNRLVAPGLKIGKGGKAVATLTMADKKKATVRFAVD